MRYRALLSTGALSAVFTLTTGCDKLAEMKPAASSSAAATGTDEHSHDGGDDHAHEEEQSAQITLWDEKFEIFLEHDYIIAGEPVNFVTHATNLETLEPRASGPMTFILSHPAAAPISHVVDEPARDGIYIPELTFPRPGLWEVALMIPSNGKSHVIRLPTIEVFESEHDVAHAPAGDHIEGISYLKEQQWKVPTETQAALRRDVSEQLRLVGAVNTIPSRQGMLAPFVAGALMAPDGGELPSVGHRVEAGAILARIQPPMAGADLLSYISERNAILAMEVGLKTKRAEAEAGRAQARVAIEYAEEVYARTEKLHASAAKSDRELAAALYEVRRAKTELEAAETLSKAYAAALAELSQGVGFAELADGFPVVELAAPVSGTVTEVFASAGEHVVADEHILKIEDTSHVYIEVKIPEGDWGRLGSSPRAFYIDPDDPERIIEINEASEGRMVFAGVEVDKATRTVPLVYEIANPNGALRIGAALDVFLQTSAMRNALTAPGSAIVEEEGRSTVYVQLAGETFERRDVTLGMRGPGWVEILAGVQEGERVVTRGAYLVRLASVGGAVPSHGHAH